MVIDRPAYCTREDVRAALDWAPAVRVDARIDAEIAASSDTIDRVMHRVFYPRQRTQTFDWPNHQYARSWVLWLNEHELISVDTLTAGGVTISAGDFFLRPDDGPPFRRIELDLSSSAAFGGGDTPQRDVSVTGLFGYSDTETTATTLAEALDATETAVDVTDSSAVGVGDLIRVDDERMLVVGKQMLSTGDTLQADITAASASETVTVTNGTAFAAGETVLVDAERMLIEDITGGTLTVRRAIDGTTLAAHTTGTTIYAPRTLTVTRGAAGSTAATHLTAAAVSRWMAPSPVRRLCLAETIATLEQQRAAYSRAPGTGGTTTEQAGVDLPGLWEHVYTGYGRKARIRAV